MAAVVSQAATVPVYKDPKAPLEARVNDLFSKLTQDEKLSLLTGTDFSTRPVDRLGLPPVGMVDAGQGVRGGLAGTQGPATAFPAGVLLASTWDTDLVSRVGKAIGEETLNKGIGAQTLLAPGINIHRSPLGGRNGEYFSEDPYLAGQLAVGYIEGVQSTGCAACVKHFACNNEEIDRGFVDTIVDERTLREIYLPAFEAAVKQGHVWSIMSSYNRINGYHATANWYLLTNVLKTDWGFDGLVMSDWGAVHETIGVVNAGNDLEMPGPGFLSHDNLKPVLNAGLVQQASIDDAVHRVLRLAIRTGLLDGPRIPDHKVVNSVPHEALTLEAASKGMVLLKNEGNLLPLDPAKLKSIAVIGTRSRDWQIGGGGSPGVSPFYNVPPIQGIRWRVGPGVNINYAAGIDTIGEPIPSSALKPSQGKDAHGLTGTYFKTIDLSGDPVITRTDRAVQFGWSEKERPAGIPHEKFSVRWMGKLTAPVTGTYSLVLTADDGCRLYVDGKQVISHWQESSASPVAASVDLVAGKSYDIKIEYYQATGDASIRFNWMLPHANNAFQGAVEAARKSDVAVVVVGSSFEGEGSDKASMALPDMQSELIQAVVAANKNTIVVMNNGTPCLMTDWLGKVPALLEAWFPGQEGGAALAAVLFGDVNPSGKLPDTLGARREDYPDYGNFPGVKGVVRYKEGIYVGYRHFDKAAIQPVFPFGYGLSYTTFRYSNVHLSKADLTPDGSVTVTADITNTGTRAGAEVVELYVHPQASVIDRAVRELKGFTKLELQPGETKTAAFTVDPSALKYCDVPGKQWKADAGVYDIEIAASSRDIRLTAPLRLTSDYTKAIPTMGAENPLKSPVSMATGKSVTASSVEHDNLPEYAEDNDLGSRWESKWSDPQWLAVDLGAPKSVGSVLLLWEQAYAAGYKIQVSDDGATWKTVYTTDKGQGGTESVRFKPVTARWVRLYCTKRAASWGYSLYDFGVYAN